jgi:hypothetical protein
MMQRTALIVVCLFAAVSAHAATLKMPAAPTIELEPSDGEVPRPLSVGLFVPDDVKDEIFVVKTSPFDRIKYPIGGYTVDVFATNLPQVFSKVIEVGGPKAAGVDLVIEVDIVRFEATIPHPAYNPYTATAVYKITVRNSSGETLLVQTVTGDGQTSKGMMSGFKAKRLAAESAARAMAEAAKQALEALADAPELAEIQDE